MANILTSLTIPNAIPFTLSADYACTSAGIYNSSNVLVRTLWSNVPYKAGSHFAKWDGLDDNGIQQTYNVSYTLRVSSNNITYVWEGAIGNNSDNSTGSTVHRMYEVPTVIREVGNYMYYGTAYCEGDVGQMRFLKTTPRQKIRYLPQKAGQDSYHICSNGTYVFYGGYASSGASNSFVFATLISNDSEATFTTGASVVAAPTKTYSSVLDLTTISSNSQTETIQPGNPFFLTGMDVQQAGNGYLFCSHFGQNLINVYKTGDGTGSFVRAITITGPTNLFLENDTTLWIAQTSTLTKYTVNSDGTITATGSQITGFTNICSLSIHSGEIAVFDGGLQSIPKFYNSTTLSVIVKGTWVVGGYSTSPVVADNKFYSYDNRLQYPVSISHESSGGFWITDPGNYRMQHFDSSGTYIDSIYYIPRMYCVNLCGNQNTSLFANYCEYTIDYAQPLSTGWTLTNNWGFNVPANYFVSTQGIGGVTLISGRRYMLLTPNLSNYFQAELVAGVGMRLIANTLPQFCTMDTNGDLYTYTSSVVSGNATFSYQKKTFTGLDGSNNPIYSAPTTIATFSLGHQETLPVDRYFIKTSSGKIILFSSAAGTTRFGGLPTYHLGGYDGTTFAKLWSACKALPPTYSGDYVLDGSFDEGNLVNYPGGTCKAIGNNIFWNYHGEGWKNSQNNWVYHYDDWGLLQGIFGNVGLIAPVFNINESIAGMVCNVTKTVACQVGVDIYIFQNDESNHSGVTRWKVSNLSSIVNQSISFTLINRTLSVPINKVDLLAGVPEGQVSMSGTTGWSQFPASDVNTGAMQLYTITRKLQPDLTLSPDIIVKGVGNTNVTYYLQRQLTTLTSLHYWVISGKLDYSVNSFSGSATSSARFFLTILDNNGKILVKLEPQRNNIAGTYFSKMIFNGIDNAISDNNGSHYGISDFVIKREGSNIMLLINMFGQWIYSSQPISDNTGDISSPAVIKWNFQFSSANSKNAQFGIVQLFFDGI